MYKTKKPKPSDRTYRQNSRPTFHAANSWSYVARVALFISQSLWAS